MTFIPEKFAQIDACLANWCQGDVIILDPVPFVHLADLALPTTLEAEQVADRESRAGIATVSVDLRGLVVITQTCDLVRTCRDRPYVEVCPLVVIPTDKVSLVRHNRIPRYLPLPAIEDPSLAGDLGRVMTVEKGLLVPFELACSVMRPVLTVNGLIVCNLSKAAIVLVPIELSAADGF